MKGDLVWILRGTTNPPYQPDDPIQLGYTPPPFMLSNGLGFWWFKSSSAGGYTLVGIPYWSLVVCTAVPPLVGLARTWRRTRRRRAGLCAECGYDLRAHAKGERCPECGTV
jgi:hypothetical protein